MLSVGKSIPFINTAHLRTFKTVTGLAEVMLLGGLGGLCPDVDLKGSIGERLARVLEISVIVAGGVSCLLGAHPIKLLWVACLAIVLEWGKRAPHRGRTHSFVYCGLTTILVGGAVGIFSIYWCIGFLSHLVLDLLNKKGEALIWPVPKRYCLNLCVSNGKVNAILLGAGVMLSLAGILRWTILCGNVPLPKIF